MSDREMWVSDPNGTHLVVTRDAVLVETVSVAVLKREVWCEEDHIIEPGDQGDCVPVRQRWVATYWEEVTNDE